MSKKLFSFALSLLLAGNSIAASMPESGGARLLVGQWKWTRQDIACTEIYDYRADGTYTAISGNEKTDNTYTISELPSVNGFYKVVVHVIKDYGGTDCGLSDSDDTGTSFTNYFLFNASGNQYMACYSESKNDCFGILTRTDAKPHK